MLQARLGDDVVSLILLGAIATTAGLPALLLVGWKVTRPPFHVLSFRWLYLVWVLLLGASSVWNLSRDVRFSVEEAGADNYVRLAFLSLGVLLLLAVGARYRFAFFSDLRTGVLGLFSLFATWGLLSTLWSVSSAGTLIKASEYCAMLAVFALTVSLIASTVRDPRSQPYAVKKVFDFGWFLIFSLIASVYLGMLVWPEYAIMSGYREGILGFWIQGALPAIAANSVGHIGAVMGIVAIVRLLFWPGSKVLYGSLLAVSLVTMVLTQSRSPILALCVAVIVVLVAGRRFGLLLLSGGLMGVAFLTRYSHLIYAFMQRNQTDENLASLTGRVDYWRSSIEALGNSPLGGYGANVGGRYVLQDALGEDVSTVHSTWVEVALDTGIVGLLLFSLALAATWFWLIRLYPYVVRHKLARLLWFESLGVLTILCVRSFFAVDLVWSWHVLTFGLVLVFISVMRRQVVGTTHAGDVVAQPVPAARRRRSGVYR
ncbi:hypothetical protein GBA63_18300 [Rubrobacter tropicus]|uniref:O-antigen ligase-related domain-containing protein n=1 Tax=Rubrobacter tropicus TaxID=2653851 RepID=A0A6G8QD45_9ACTN|nr:O-antigen ligase family protein [Rubrobacter tropicus]QIN84373.1 hypothetical protein GBA63_18300 [Rubrobacter tropicus]